MHGLNCGRCHGERGPYLTAYEIAVKHGYEGSEDDWIETIQSVFVARVTANNEVYWECDTSYEELLARSAIQEVHLLTLEGRTAFLNGASENKILFQTLPYEDEQIGNVYEMYEWIADGEQRVYWLDAYAPGQGSITKNMLATAVQNELDGAVQKNAQAAKESYQTQEVGVDANGKLWVFQPTDFIPATEQTAKTEAMTCEVGLDGEGQLWAEGYKKPGTGIPETDLASDLAIKVNKAGLKSIGFRDDGGGTYTFVGADFNFTSLNDLISKLESGTNLRLVLTNTLNTYPAVHYQGADSLARLYFAGPTIQTTPIGMSLDCFELKDSVSLTRVYHEAI